jgi:hypothetical protein
MQTRDELLAAAEREYAAFSAALKGLDDARMTEVWLGTWSAKDIVAHMAGWHREMIPVLERLARGERPLPEGVSYDDVDAWNAKFAAARRGTPTEEIRRELEASHGAFLKAAAAVPAERYQPGKTAWKVVDLNSAHHYQEHGGQIRDWRKERGL